MDSGVSSTVARGREPCMDLPWIFSQEKPSHDRTFPRSRAIEARVRISHRRFCCSLKPGKSSSAAKSRCPAQNHPVFGLSYDSPTIPDPACQCDDSPLSSIVVIPPCRMLLDDVRLGFILRGHHPTKFYHPFSVNEDISCSKASIYHRNAIQLSELVKVPKSANYLRVQSNTARRGRRTNLAQYHRYMSFFQRYVAVDNIRERHVGHLGTDANGLITAEDAFCG